MRPPRVLRHRQAASRACILRRARCATCARGIHAQCGRSPRAFPRRRTGLVHPAADEVRARRRGRLPRARLQQARRRPVLPASRHDSRGPRRQPWALAVQNAGGGPQNTTRQRAPTSPRSCSRPRTVSAGKASTAPRPRPTRRAIASPRRLFVQDAPRHSRPQGRRSKSRGEAASIPQVRATVSRPGP